MPVPGKEPPNSDFHVSEATSGRVVVAFCGDSPEDRRTREIWNRLLRPVSKNEISFTLLEGRPGSISWEDSKLQSFSIKEAAKHKVNLDNDIADLESEISDLSARSQELSAAPPGEGKVKPKVLRFTDIQAYETAQSKVNDLRATLGRYREELKQTTWLLKNAKPNASGEACLPKVVLPEPSLKVWFFGTKPSREEIKRLQLVYSRVRKDSTEAKAHREMFVMAPETAVVLKDGFFEKYNPLLADDAKKLSSWYRDYQLHKIRSMGPDIKEIWAWKEAVFSWNATAKDGDKVPVPSGLHAPREKPFGDKRKGRDSEISELRAEFSKLASLLATKAIAQVKEKERPAPPEGGMARDPERKPWWCSFKNVVEVAPQHYLSRVSRSILKNAPTSLPIDIAFLYVKSDSKPGYKRADPVVLARQLGAPKSLKAVLILLQDLVDDMFKSNFNVEQILTLLGACHVTDLQVSFSTDACALQKDVLTVVKKVQVLAEGRVTYSVVDDLFVEYGLRNGFFAYHMGKRLATPIFSLWFALGKSYLETTSQWYFDRVGSVLPEFYSFRTTKMLADDFDPDEDDLISIKDVMCPDQLRNDVSFLGFMEDPKLADRLSKMTTSVATGEPTKPAPESSDAFAQWAKDRIRELDATFEESYGTLQRMDDFHTYVNAHDDAVNALTAVWEAYGEDNHYDDPVFEEVLGYRLSSRGDYFAVYQICFDACLAYNRSQLPSTSGAAPASPSSSEQGESGPETETPRPFSPSPSSEFTEGGMTWYILDDNLASHETPAGVSILVKIRNGMVYTTGGVRDIRNTTKYKDVALGDSLLRVYQPESPKMETLPSKVAAPTPKGKEVQKPKQAEETTTAVTSTKGKNRPIPPPPAKKQPDPAPENKSGVPKPLLSKYLRKLEKIPGRGKDSQLCACNCVIFPCNHTRQDVQWALRHLKIEPVNGNTPPGEAFDASWTSVDIPLEGVKDANTKKEDPLKKENPARIDDLPKPKASAPHTDRISPELLSKLRTALKLDTSPLPANFKELSKKDQLVERRKRAVPRWATAAVAADPANLGKIKKGEITSKTPIAGPPRGPLPVNSSSSEGSNKTHGERWKALKDKFTDVGLWSNPSTQREKQFKTAFDALKKDIGDSKALPRPKRRPRNLPNASTQSSGRQSTSASGGLNDLINLAKGLGEIMKALKP